MIPWTEKTVYTCRNGCGVIVVVGTVSPDRVPRPGRGYRLGNYVIRNVEDLTFPVVPGGPSILFPASGNAFAKKPGD